MTISKLRLGGMADQYGALKLWSGSRVYAESELSSQTVYGYTFRAVGRSASALIMSLKRDLVWRKGCGI